MGMMGLGLKKGELPRATTRMAEISSLTNAEHTPVLILAVTAKKVNKSVIFYCHHLKEGSI